MRLSQSRGLRGGGGGKVVTRGVAAAGGGRRGGGGASGAAVARGAGGGIGGGSGCSGCCGCSGRAGAAGAGGAAGTTGTAVAGAGDAGSAAATSPVRRSRASTASRPPRSAIRSWRRWTSRFADRASRIAQTGRPRRKSARQPRIGTASLIGCWGGAKSISASSGDLPSLVSRAAEPAEDPPDQALSGRDDGAGRSEVHHRALDGTPVDGAANGDGVALELARGHARLMPEATVRARPPERLRRFRGRGTDRLFRGRHGFPGLRVARHVPIGFEGRSGCGLTAC